MVNFKRETLQVINNKTIGWACFKSSEDNFLDKTKTNRTAKVILSPEHTEEELNDFINRMDFDYCNFGNSSLEISGIIVFKNNSWITREYVNGHEYWKEHYYPKFEDYISF